MDIFNGPNDEERLCQVLKAYVEEWGVENVSISVPVRWKKYRVRESGRLRFCFETENAVAIKVECESIRLVYEVQLRAA